MSFTPDPHATSARRAIAIVLAGGMGSRFGGPLPKQLIDLDGRPLLAHALEKFASLDDFSAVYVVANPAWSAEITEIAHQALAGVHFEVVPGGQSRNESVWNALTRVSADDSAKCLIHDGVRPLVTESLISDVLESLDSVPCVVPVIDAIDPLFLVEGNRVVSVADRSRLVRGQSPQGFNLGVLRSALAELGVDRMAEYSTLFEAVRVVFPEIEIATVQGEGNNIKVTQAVDHIIAGGILEGLRA